VPLSPSPVSSSHQQSHLLAPSWRGCSMHGLRRLQDLWRMPRLLPQFPCLVLSKVRLYTPGGCCASTFPLISGAIQSYQQEQQVFQPRGRVSRPPQAAPGRTGCDAGPAASAMPPISGRYLPILFIASSSSYPRLGGALWRKQRRS
jgi:hypothetical protein